MQSSQKEEPHLLLSLRGPEGRAGWAGTALEGPGTITSHRHANLPYVVQDSHCFTLNNELL